jgi:hypothetical protein
MFDKEYSFRGIHALRVKSMVRLYEDAKFPIFERNFDVYLIAPIVGFMYGKTNIIDISVNSKADIFPDILMKNNNDLMFNYKLIMLLNSKYEPDLKKRIDKAFNYYNNDKIADDEKMYNSYVLGGVDVLYEKLIENSINIDDCLNNLYDFIEDFNERYGEKINNEDLSELFLLADI